MINEKRVFARLLAKEDIVVVQSTTAKTASFNVVSRTITFPNYSNMEDANYDGFTCHEVGHALHTGEDIMAMTARFGKAVVNVVEDLRINNLMKSEFKGISNIFAKHYGILDDRNFFGDYGFESGFIDKINIANKLRVNLFQTPEERAFWTKFSNLETVEEFEKACEYVVDYYKNEDKEDNEPEIETGGFGEESDAPSIIIPEDDESDEESVEGESSVEESEDESADEESIVDGDADEEGETEADVNTDESEESNEDSDSDVESEDDSEGESDIDSDEVTGGESKGDSDESDDNEAGDGSDASDSDEESEEEDDFDPDSITAETEDEFENSLAETVDTSYDARKNTPFIIPRTKDMLDMTIPIKDVSLVDRESLNKRRVADSEWNEFNAYKKKTVNRMVSMFNRKKAASEYHRRKFSETGTLNMRKLHEYKTNDNIFLKNMKIAEGKNHGVVFYLDNSSSMHGAYGKYIIKQIAIMVDFCRKLSIPYTVLGYSYADREIVKDDSSNPQTITNARYDVELLTHTQSETEHNEFMFSLYNLLSYGSITMSFAHNYQNYSVKMYGTPLCASIINSIKYVDTFKKKNNVQIMNVMYFTDGEDGYGLQTETGMILRRNDSKFVDAETKKKYDTSEYFNKAKQAQSMVYANIVKDRFNCNVFFFRIPKYVTRIGHMFCQCDWDDKAFMSKSARMLKRDTFFKVEEDSGVEHFLLYTNVDDPEEKDFSKIDVKSDKSGKVTKSSFNQLKREIKSSNSSRKGSYMFADLVAQKVAEGF